jgi:peptidoglycan/LPS O-acetylase OafA/YrhL
MTRSFEGGRGAAALLVALFHMSLGDSRIVLRLPGAYIFVDLFFVLSGFLICSTYGKKLGSARALPSFLLRRFGRLFPLLMVATVAYVAMLNAGVLAHRVLDGPSAPLRPFVVPTLRETLAMLSMMHSMGVFDHVILNYASWSISTEFYAYIFFALLCLMFRGRTRLIAFALTVVVGYLLTAWATVHVHQCLKWGNCLDLTFDYGFVRCVTGFFLGALLSYLRVAGHPWRGAMQAASVAALALMFVFMQRHPVLALAAPLLFACFLLSISSDTGPVAALLNTGPMQFLGQQSYSIYLMHPVLLLGFNGVRPYATSWLGQLLFLLAYAAMVLLVSRWTFRLVEDPARKMFNRIAATWRFAAPNAVPAKEISTL